MDYTYALRLSRTILAKVDITYTNPLRADYIQVSPDSTAYNTSGDNLVNLITFATQNTFTTFDSDLSGNFILPDSSSEIGWWPTVLSDSNGDFNSPVNILFTFTSRPIVTFNIYGDDIKNIYPVDFVLTFTDSLGVVTTETIVGHNSTIYTYNNSLTNIVSLEISITKINQPNMPPILTEVSLGSRITYMPEDIISLDLLEELDYATAAELLGGLGSNIINIQLRNDHRQFSFDNTDSLVANNLRKNRKIVPWIGYYYPETAVTEWYRIGTFWSNDWQVPQNRVYAEVYGVDTLSFLANTTFSNHTVFNNYSIYDLAEYILMDAQQIIAELSYDIDESLKNIIIPYAWFSRASHRTALNKIANTQNVHIYCDTNGEIQIKQLSVPATTLTTWSEADIILETTYPTLYTAPINKIEVITRMVTFLPNQTLINVTQAQNVVAGQELIFSSSGIIADTTQTTLAVDTTISYTTELFSWGLILRAQSAGEITSLTLTGTQLQADPNITVIKQDEDAIAQDGENKQVVTSDFIQTVEHATWIAETLFTAAQTDRFDANITYAGDAAIALTDAVTLADSTSPTKDYLLKMRKLFWNGSLSGEASLFII